MANYKIKESVGELGKNQRDDVLVVQTLLKDFYDPPEPGDPTLDVNGVCDRPTVEAIVAFQALFVDKPDGRIDPNGTTLKRLVEAINLDLQPLPLTGEGYYQYVIGSRQWGTAKTIAALREVCTEFSVQKPSVRIGIGDISFRMGGKMKPHDSHQKGRNIDIRPLRKDGSQEPVAIDNGEYSHEDTALLVTLLNQHKNVRSILFNDNKIKGVSYYKGHHNHLHVNMKQ